MVCTLLLLTLLYQADSHRSASCECKNCAAIICITANICIKSWLTVYLFSSSSERTSGYCIGNACFTLFRDPSTFSSAQQLCRDQNSHLMTVRTSVSSDVLTVLLGNLTGSFWIGLHRLSGCPNLSEELRGFQWVTKDTESDFVNWEPDFDYSCAAARCVSVNGDENFKWRQTPCDQPAAGFLCENSFVDPCTNLPHAAEHGYRLVGGACVDTDECTLAPCEHECTNSRGSYVCSCFKGYRVDEKDPHKCRLHCGEQMCPAECDPNNNFQCFCPDGYLLEERGGSSFCIDINECDSNYCDQECRNTYGGYVCSCKPGFKLVDEDQCREVDDEDSSTLSIPTSPTYPHPDPTRRPSAVTAGGLVGIIVSTVFIIVLAVFATHEDMHGLQRLSDSRRDKVV
uniref:Thrombomodulin n=1 Tax=Poecilia mexicana TaxID=48701 RepID=A0A3B3YZY6_9TELE